jgi:hypothetical protein
METIAAWTRAAVAAFCLFMAAAGPSAAQEVFHGCPVTGDARSEAVRALDALKNRFTAPARIDPAVTLDAILAPGDDRDRWSPHMGAGVEGYVAEVYKGGVETANCHARDERHRDTHIVIAASPEASAEPQTMIAEVTPRWRAIMARRGVDWSTPTLRNMICHHWVRVTGWLLFDFEHGSRSRNTATRPGVWRATAWEIHPITSIGLLDRPAGPPCSP